jgi:hypothetical protein
VEELAERRTSLEKGDQVAGPVEIGPKYLRTASLGELCARCEVETGIEAAGQVGLGIVVGPETEPWELNVPSDFVEPGPVEGLA